MENKLVEEILDAIIIAIDGIAIAISAVGDRMEIQMQCLNESVNEIKSDIGYMREIA